MGGLKDMNKDNKGFAIINARIFDGEQILDSQSVLIDEKKIAKIGGEIPDGIEIIDGSGCTLLPGLIDSHTHTTLDYLQEALRFGVTTEFDMTGFWTVEARKKLEENDSSASVIACGCGLTPTGGHPDELSPGKPSSDNGLGQAIPRADTSEEAALRVDEAVANGADFIKFFLEEGTVFAAPGTPLLKNEALVAGVKRAHELKKLAVAHALTTEAAKQAVDAGVDGLAHLFLDRLDNTAELIAFISKAGIFVIPCLCLNSSLVGNTAKDFATDERVSSRSSEKWHEALCGSYSTFTQGKYEDSKNNLADLHRAGVDLLVGTDTAVLKPSHGHGLAHGASVHHEMQLLVQAGITPLEVLRSATSVPAKRFGLKDRGRIFEGARADLLLVDGNPTVNISDTLNIRHIWRCGSHRGNGKRT